MTTRAAAFLGLSLVLCACTSGETPTAGHSQQLRSAARAAAVVADISVGTNPYHEIFRRPGWTEHPCKIIPSFPCDAPALNLTLGADYAASLAADSAVWASYRKGTVYWVPGTNLLLLTTRGIAEGGACGEPCDIGDGYGGAGVGHGLASSGAAAAACPDCYVLVIQDAPSADGSALEYVAANLPWVDFVTQTAVSGGGNPFAFAADPLNSNFFAERVQAASQHLHDSGRLYFSFSGDYAVASVHEAALLPGADLPPWVIAVGGMTHVNPYPGAQDTECNAIEAMSGVPADLLGDFLQKLPRRETVSDYGVAGGTSFSTPQVAGYFGQALAGLRQRLGDARAAGALWSGAPQAAPDLADGVLTADEMRHAFQAAARYFSPADFNPACAAEMAQLEIADAGLYLPQRPASPAPWVDMGWGYVDKDTVNAVSTAWADGTALAEKPVTAVGYLNALMTIRETAFPLP